MCTLTFVPTSSSSYIFTSNRDERKSRMSAFVPTLHEEKRIKFIAPIDGEALGTWLGASEETRVVCLLNGGNEAHISKPPYRHSRGKVVIDTLVADNAMVYVNETDFENIEPFTLIIIENKPSIELFEFIWDGKEKHISKLDTSRSHIWSSSTLYSNFQKKERSKKFMNWLEEGEKSSEEILYVHEALEKGEMLGLSMSRPQYCTVSTTQLEVNSSSANMYYHDRLTLEKEMVQLKFTLVKS